MAGVGTFEKCKRQIEGGIKRQKKDGANYVALDLPYFTVADKANTDAYIQELERRGFSIKIEHKSSSKYGRASWA